MIFTHQIMTLRQIHLIQDRFYTLGSSEKLFTIIRNIYDCVQKLENKIQPYQKVWKRGKKILNNQYAL